MFAIPCSDMLALCISCERFSKLNNLIRIFASKPQMNNCCIFKTTSSWDSSCRICNYGGCLLSHVTVELCALVFV